MDKNKVEKTTKLSRYDLCQLLFYRAQDLLEGEETELELTDAQREKVVTVTLQEWEQGLIKDNYVQVHEKLVKERLKKERLKKEQEEKEAQAKKEEEQKQGQGEGEEEEK